MMVAALLAACILSDGTVTNGVRWIDGHDLPIEGKGFVQTAAPYGRMGVLQSPTEGLVEIADWGEGDCLV